MNHLGRRTNVAKALYRGLITEMLEHGKIETTLAKAKSVQGEIDKLINWAKEGTINARRLTVKTLGNDRYFDKFNKIKSNRRSGYTRIIRLGQRLSDAAEMVVFELVDKPIIEPVAVEEPKTVKKIAKQNVKNN